MLLGTVDAVSISEMLIDKISIENVVVLQNEVVLQTSQFKRSKCGNYIRSIRVAEMNLLPLRVVAALPP